MAWERWSATAVAAKAVTPATACPAASSGEESSEDDDLPGEPLVWEVIGGGRNSGLQVRIGQSLSSEVASSRLATGALVRQRRLVGNRLHYELLSGTGPPSGWVTISLGNKALLVRRDDDADEGKVECSGGSGEAADTVDAADAESDQAASDQVAGAPRVARKLDFAAAADAESDEAASDQAVGCSSCRCPLRWSDFAQGDYAEGWDCENLASCCNSSFNCGPYRWFCAGCQVDVCDSCFQRRCRAQRCRAEQASEEQAASEASPSSVPSHRRSSASSRPSRSSRTRAEGGSQASKRRPAKFAWDYPLSQAEGRTRCLTSDTVAGNIQRLAELQERNSALEASQARWEVERGLLLARVERLESLLRRSNPSAVAAGLDAVRCPSPDADFGEASGSGEAARSQEAALGVELSVAVEKPGAGSAVSCLCFGQERHYLDHVLLAIGYADGLAALYRCDRAGPEPRASSPLLEGACRLRRVQHRSGCTPLFPRVDASGGDGGTGSLPSHPLPGRLSGASSSAGTRSGELVLLRRLVGHTRAILSMAFSPLEEQLLTASRDHGLRVWDVASGELRAVFTDASLVAAAAFLPLNPGTFVAAVLGADCSRCDEDEDAARPMRHSSRRASLRLVSAQTSSVLHALPAASDVHALCFDSTGRFLLAGTRRSSLLALEVTALGDRLVPRVTVPLGAGKVTSIVRASGHGSSSGRPRVLISSEGKDHSSVTVADCVYAPQAAGGHLLNFTNQRQVSISDRPLPFPGCYCPFGSGLLISGSTDGGLLLYTLDGVAPRRLEAPHAAALSAASASSQGTLVASADAKGAVVVWRCRPVEAEVEEELQEPAASSGEGAEPVKPEAGQEVVKCEVEDDEVLKKPLVEPTTGDVVGTDALHLRNGEEAEAQARAAARKARRDAKVEAKLAERPAAKELQASCRPVLLDREPGKGRLWIVVGGSAKGGIPVRSCENLTSMVYRARLATGATVEELQLTGTMLHYRRVRGDGPETGWVKLKYGGEPLLELQQEAED